MARYEYRGKEEYWRIVVGWDKRLESFFAQVWDERPNPEWDWDDEWNDLEPELWIGTATREVQTLKELASLVAPYGEIPEETKESLLDDHDRRTPPTPAQRRNRFM